MMGGGAEVSQNVPYVWFLKIEAWGFSLEEKIQWSSLIKIRAERSSDI
jgi:hypothetical protein